MYCKYLKSVNARAIPRGGGCNTPHPKKSKKGGPNLRGGGPSWHAGIAKFLGGPWNGRGPKFWNTPPPNRKPVGWHGTG